VKSVIRKAVFPAAGLGTRFLPVTKAQPKEMLPLVDKPIIQYGVEEAVASGVSNIILVTGRGKNAIEDHFDVSVELETFLEARGKKDLLDQVRAISNLINFSYVRQGEPLGLGHAVLVTRTLVGGDEGLSDAGLSVSKLILNPVMFLEATGEVFRGHSDVFNGTTRSDLTYVGRLRGYRDLTEGTNLDLGASIAWGSTEVAPDSTKRLIGVDATFRYRPLRRAIYQRMIARSELIWSQDRFAGGSPTAFGMYASGEYQFARRWFAGGRFDYSERPLFPSLSDKGGAAILTYWPSEFSQIRGQYRRTRYAEGTTANELLFQFLFSIGAHGAHVF